MKTKLLRISVLFVIAFFFSCTGDDGATGPAGVDGNANVVGTNPFTVSSWTANSSGFAWSVTVNTPQITQAILDKGIVAVYLQNGSASSWAVLPLTIIRSTDTNLLVDSSFSLGSIKIEVASTDALAITNPGSLTFRVVIISATSKLAANKQKVDLSNYDEVKAFYKLKD